MNRILRAFSFVNCKRSLKGSVVLIDEIMSRGRKQTTHSGCYSDKERLVWVDCEMTGLDIDTCHLLEVACLITDDQLNIVAESGLTEQVRQSSMSLQQAEMELVSFVRQHTPRGSCPLAGNTVHADKKFLDKYMPQFVDHLHYRIVDVSTVKELCRRWFPKEYEVAPRKAASHRALEDIKESIKELQYYRQAIFKCPLD